VLTEDGSVELDVPRDRNGTFEPQIVAKGEARRKYGVSDATFYKWRSKYGGMDVSDARKLKALEDENRRLKKLLAESMLDNAALKELLAKNW